MPIYIKTLAFSTTGNFNSKKDDRKVNATLKALHERGANVTNITVALGGMALQSTATYLITYEAPQPID